MKRNILFNFLALVIVFFLILVPCFADGENNIISKIIVESPSKNNYSFNMLFNETYKGNAFLQKVEAGSYNIFLPDTAIKGRTPKVVFKNSADKSKIKLNIEKKPFVKGDKTTDYVKITVNMADDYSIKLLSGLASDYNTTLIALKSFNYGNVLVLLLLGIAAYCILKVYKKCMDTEINYYRASRSYDYLKEQTKYYDDLKRTTDEKVQKEIEKKENTKRQLRHADKSSFDCFELPYAEKSGTNDAYEINSTLSQASRLLKQKPSLVKLRHTNPIVRTSNNDYSGLQMPAIEDIMPRKKKVPTNIENIQQSNAELLSVLNITPNKGFYLTTVDDNISLFGFINENVFLFANFKDLSQINLQARFYDKNGDNDIYIVRIDDYKAMIEISDTSMKELAKI